MLRPNVFRERKNAHPRWEADFVKRTQSTNVSRTKYFLLSGLVEKLVAKLNENETSANTSKPSNAREIGHQGKHCWPNRAGILAENGDPSWRQTVTNGNAFTIACAYFSHFSLKSNQLQLHRSIDRSTNDDVSGNGNFRAFRSNPNPSEACLCTSKLFDDK